MKNLQIKKHEMYKQLCIASYKPFEQNNTFGYNLVATIPGKNGFFACIYRQNDEMVIVYRGTEINDKNDIENDKQMLRNKLPEQTKNALEIYDRMYEICKENGYKLSLTGHSLGGSLAAIISAMRGVEAVTFNPYGVKNLLNPNIKYITDKVTNYCCENDIITIINAENHIGKCYTVKPKNILKVGHFLENMDSLDNREEVYGPYLQYQYEKDERSKKEFDEYRKYGRRIMRMPGLYSNDNQSGCAGSYPVSSYTRDDGTKVDGYIRTCYKHGY